MMSKMSTRIVTAREAKGPKWAARFPEKAGELWVVARYHGKKVARRIGPDTPEKRERAERKLAEWEHAFDQERGDLSKILPTLAEAGAAYLRSGLQMRAPGTVKARKQHLKLLGEGELASLRLDRIDAGVLVNWWAEFVDAGGRDWRTGNCYLVTISQVFVHARKTWPQLANPVAEAKQQVLTAIRNTAEFRARDEENCKPLDVAELKKFLPALYAYGNQDLLITVLLMYEGGLRIGEALGLRWSDVWWGKDDSDTKRHLSVQGSRIGKRRGRTKSGRSRNVALSRRLRHVLQVRYLERGRPAGSRFVVNQSWPKNIRERLGRVYKTAGIDPHNPKDFRDTFASQLVTHGIVLKWISLQLGHGNVGITEKHYAAWMAVDGYQNPWQVPPGCLPVDLFAQLDGWAVTTASPSVTQRHQIR